MNISIRSIVFTVFVALLQVTFLILYITLVEYGTYGLISWGVNKVLVPAPLMALKNDTTTNTKNMRGADPNLNLFDYTLVQDQITKESFDRQGPDAYTQQISTVTTMKLQDYYTRFYIPAGTVLPVISTDPTLAPVYSFVPVFIMIFLGLGLLYSHIRCTSYSGLAMVFFLGSFTFVWASFVVPWIMQASFQITSPQDIYYNIAMIMEIGYCVFSLMVSYGALIGRASKMQLVIIMLFGVVLYATNRMLAIRYLVVADLGGSMTVHTFGAFYGLTVSFTIFVAHKFNKCCFKSDAYDPCCIPKDYVAGLFSLVGTIILFLFFPSFNAYLLPVTLNLYLYAMVNTVFALFGSIITVYVLSSAVTKCQKFDIVHIQFAAVSGGVAASTVAGTRMEIWGAFLLGIFVGFMVVVLLKYVQPYLCRIWIYDSAYVFSLFAFPGIIGGIAGAIMAGISVKLDYLLVELHMLYPAMYFLYGANSPRTAVQQGGYQFAVLVISMSIAIVGGLLVGAIVRFLGPFEDEEIYDDTTEFVLHACCASAGNCCQEETCEPVKCCKDQKQQSC